MARHNVSPKFLIHLVGERPALWDKTSDEYKDRSLREASWIEICTFINENFPRMAPRMKEEFIRVIMKKWAQIRDSWVKSMKYGYDEKTKKPLKPYLYHNELKFLQKILKPKAERFNSGISFLSNDGFFGNNTETQYNFGDFNGDRNKAEPEDEANETHDEIVETAKQDTETKMEATQITVNHEDKTFDDDDDDDDDWPIDEVDITQDIKLNKTNNENEYQQSGISLYTPLVRKRSSIFISGNCSSENQKETQRQTPANSQFQTKPPSTLPPLIKRPSTTFHADEYLNDNRHLSFFKGIMPSINSLDEDHTLQFQVGVITLLQKLRESQSRIQRTSKPHRKGGRARKNKSFSNEWPEPTMDISQRFLSSTTKNIADPIGTEESENSLEE